MEANRLRFRAWDTRLKTMQTGYGFLIGADGQFYTDSGWDSVTASKHRSEEYIPMRSTGLTDKNGAEIFEGDILQVRLNDEWHSERDPVEMYAGCWHWRGYTVNSVAHESEVIGNIHENPELLKINPE